MKSALAFVAGMLVGVLLTFGGGTLFRHPGHHGEMETASGRLPAEILSGLKAMRGDLEAMIRALEEPGPSPQALRRPVTRSMRMSRTEVVLTQPLPVSGGVSVPGPPAPGGEATEGRGADNQTMPEVPAKTAGAKADAPAQPLADSETAAPGPGPSATATRAAAKKSLPAATPEHSYARALKDYEAGRYELAREGFAAFMRAFPRHKLLPNAFYWTGETWYAQGRYDRAAGAFERVVREYPRHAKSPDALLKLAFTAQRQGHAGQARAYLDQLESLYPDSRASRLGRQARIKLQGRNDSGTVVVARG